MGIHFECWLVIAAQYDTNSRRQFLSDVVFLLDHYLQRLNRHIQLEKRYRMRKRRMGRRRKREQKKRARREQEELGEEEED